MGVKYLWTVLAPFCDKKPLYELQGKTVAVDLSCWICEAQNIAEYQVQPRMYLRNLYFRTCYLLLMDVNPVFVLEGKAPELKYDTISARNAIQFKGARPKTDKARTGKDRTRFNFVLRQCQEMLAYMGLACVRGNGEAESLCAYLNEDGLVDGCISQDSDCFAYGAQVVYRNFSISTQGGQTASGGAVDVYDIRKANCSLSFGRNKIIAMALLIGCDYSDGVHGIGKDSVMKFFETVSDNEVLDKLRSWQKDINLYENYETQLADKNICISCGHSGRVQGHTKNGCASCKTSTGCDPFKYKKERLNMKNEVNMRNKAIKDPTFPNENLIKEFLDRKDYVKELDLNWKQPNIVKFVKFTNKFLQWEELYSFEKILPILTRWLCRNPELLKNENKLMGVVKPDRIKKVRNPKGVPSYEIIWSDPSEYFKGLIPESQIIENKVDLEKLWSTLEPQNLVDKAYPQLVENFKRSKIKPKKVNKRRNNKNGNIDEIAAKLDNASISESKSKKPKNLRKRGAVQSQFDIKSTQKPPDFYEKDLDAIKAHEMALSDVYDINLSFKQLTIRKEKRTTKTNIKILDDFVKKAVTNTYKQRTTDNEDSSNNKQPKYPQDLKDGVFNPTSSTPTKAANTDLSFDLEMSSFGDDNDLELSEIISDIVSRNDIKHNLKFIADNYCLDDEFEDDKVGVGQVYTEKGLRRTTNVETKEVEEGGGGVIFGTSHGNLESNPNQVSSFFVNNSADLHDLFEKTFNDTFKNFNDSSGNDTEEYEYDDTNDVTDGKADEDLETKLNKPDEMWQNIRGDVFLSSDSDSDSFDNNYVSLFQRLKS